jgi:Domain of unknown function (DUF4252)
MKRYLALAMFALASSMCAQTLKLAVFDKLKDKASEVTNLNLNKDLIGVGASFLGSDKDTAKLKKLAEGLNGIFIRSLAFDKEGVYTEADVKELIAELAGPGWNLVISSTENHGRDSARVWIKSSANGEVGGLRILSAESQELAVIEISGKVRVEDLKDLGALGVPDIIGEHIPPPAKKNHEELY